MRQPRWWNSSEAIGVKINYHNFYLWTSVLGFVTMFSLMRVRMWLGYELKKKHDLSLVTRWCQRSRSAACNNGNIASADFLRFSPTRRSTEGESNVNGMMWGQETDIDSVILLYDQQPRSLLPIDPIRQLICLMSPKFDFLKCEFQHTWKSIQQSMLLQ
jgi:hypothetical protein